MTKVLIVEDEPAIAELLQMNLRFASYESVWLPNGDEMIPTIHAENPDIILLDVVLPGADGFDLMKRLSRCIFLLSF